MYTCILVTPQYVIEFQAKRRRVDDSGRDSLNDSDLMLAELDIETITSQALSQASNNTQSNLRTVQDINSKVQDVSQVPNSCAKDSQSQYFSKFRNYRHTQDIDKEVVIENTLQHSGTCSSGTHVKDSSFSFSFVGEDTCCEDRTINDGRELSQRSTCDTNKRLYVQQISGSDISIGDVSINPDTSLTQTQIESLHTTQLKDHEGTRYRCTPFKRVNTEDLCTQTQDDLVARSQFESYVQATGDVSSQLKSITPCKSQIVEDVLDRSLKDSQIPSTGLCNMTGMFVETQAGPDAMNTSGDMFSTSFCDIKSQDDVLDTQADVSCHTQNLAENQCDIRLDKVELPENQQTARSNTQHSTFSKSNTNNSANTLYSGTSKVNSVLLADNKQVDVVLGDGVAYRDKSSEASTLVPKTPGQGTSSLQDKIKQRLMVGICDCLWDFVTFCLHTCHNDI